MSETTIDASLEYWVDDTYCTHHTIGDGLVAHHITCTGFLALTEHLLVLHPIFQGKLLLVLSRLDRPELTYSMRLVVQVVRIERTMST